MSFMLQSSLFVLTMLMSGCVSFFQEPGTPLAQAAHQGDIDTIRTLVAEGADVNGFGPDGNTALHWAARGGHSLGPHRHRRGATGRPLVVAALLDLGADPNLVDRRRTIPGGSSGWTPLHMALDHKEFDTATLLLERGADPNIVSQQRKSVLEMASEERAPRELLQLILARGFDMQMAERPSRR